MRDTTGVATQLSLYFPGGKLVAWKTVKNRISGILQPIFFNFHPAFETINDLISKNYWNDLDIIDQGHSRVTFHNFALDQF